jgi:sugar phosphate isomerase/epimerase
VKVGCCAYTYRHYLDGGGMTLEDFIRECYAMGLDGVDLTEYFFPTTEAAYLKKLKRLALDYGLDISGAAIGGAFAVPDAQRAEHVAFAKEWVDIAVMLGAPCLRVFAGPVPEGATEDEAMAWCIDGLKQVAPYGEEKGVVIALENHGGITSTAEQVKQLVEGVGSDWLGITLDVGNYRTDPYREIAETVPYTVTVHAKNQIGGEPPQMIDYPRVVEILRDGGFKGYLSIEFHVGPDAKVAVPRFAHYLKSLTGW